MLNFVYCETYAGKELKLEKIVFLDTVDRRRNKETALQGSTSQIYHNSNVHPLRSFSSLPPKTDKVTCALFHFDLSDYITNPSKG